VGAAANLDPSANGRGKSLKPQNYSRKSKFPYISYPFIGKLDLTNVDLLDLYLPDMHLRRRIPRRRVSYI
jgi:hypothetical protein